MNIPPEALEAGARARAICEMEYGACDGGDTNPCSCTYWAAHARAAFLAMVKAWPGMTRECVVMADRMPCIILPLPQENSDD